MITFSDKTKQLMSDINDPIRKQYLSHQIKVQEKYWIDRYNVIKDCSWPDCRSYQDFYLLPPEIQEECIIQHAFSPDIFIKLIHDDADLKFKIFDSLKYQIDTKNFLTRHQEVIENKKIIDFACNRGTWSFFAAERNCKEVIGVDVRPENIKISNSIKKDSGLSDQLINFCQSDIHDYKKNINLCRDADTVFLLGIMYHVHDHYEILRSICQPNVKNVVIETGICIHESPMIWWEIETSFELISGWDDNQPEVLVGTPSVAYFDLVLKTLGFKKIDQNFYHINVSSQKTKEFEKPRAVILYQKF